jgi:glutaredoxin-related protein
MAGRDARNHCQGRGVVPAMLSVQAMRDTFPEAKVHPAITEKIASYKKEEVDAVKALIAVHRVVVVGMTQNPFPKKARKFLDEKGIPYEYLGIGSYLSEWRRRLVLKMWTGWPTFPMIFIDGVLIGGFQDLVKLSESGDLTKMLAAPRAS